MEKAFLKYHLYLEDILTLMKSKKLLREILVKQNGIQEKALSLLAE